MLIKIQRSKDTQCPLKKKVFSFLCVSAHKDKVFQPINQRMSIKMSRYTFCPSTSIGIERVFLDNP